MLYSITGTEMGVREEGLKHFNTFGSPTHRVSTENFFDLETHVDTQDLFTSKPVVIILEEVSQNVDTRESLINLLPKLKGSSNIFLIDEPFATPALKKSLKEYSDIHFDAVEKKAAREFPFAFCNAIASKDKKAAWTEWMRVRDGEAELLLGALWWQVKKLWTEILEGKKRSYSREEIEKVGEKIVVMQHEAHRGKADLKTEIEKLVLSL